MFKKYMLTLCALGILFSTLHAQEKRDFTIAIDPEYIPFTQRDIEGNPTGLLVDFWNLWAKENGYIVHYKFYPWEETLRATENGEVDFHSGTTKDREWMFASDVIYELSTGLFVLKKSSMGTARDFVNKRIGSIDTYYGELVKRVVGKSVEIVIYDDYGPMLEALKAGEIDALVDDVEAIRYFLIKTGQINQFKKIETKQLQFTNKIYAITNQKNRPILTQINEGLEKLDLIDLVNLEEVWLPKIDEAYYNRKLSEKIEYTPKEKEWLAQHQTLRITGDPVWRRYPETEKSSKYGGVAGDYIQKFSQKMQTDFTLHPIESWAEVLATPEAQSADIILGTMNEALKSILEEHYVFLKPYEVGPLVIIMDRNIRFITDLHDVKNKKIGILSLQNYTEAIEYKYHDYKFHYFSKIDVLLAQLQEDEINAVILPLPDAILALSKEEYSDLDIIGKMDNETYVNIGILKSKPILKNIVDKVIQSTSRHDKKEILSKWTQQLNYIEKIDYRLTYSVAGLLGLVLLSTAYYAYAIRKKHHYEKELTHKLEVLALTDDLTGLQNKRAFNQNFEFAHEDKTMLGLLFIDVDYFKKYNDYYGHLEGDITLKKISDIIQSFSSGTVYPYRIGGEEFGLILYDYDEDDAVKYAEAICQKISTEQIAHTESPFGYVTVSIGVSVGGPVGNRHSLYQCADKALYAAKELGRDKVFLSNCKN